MTDPPAVYHAIRDTTTTFIFITIWDMYLLGTAYKIADINIEFPLYSYKLVGFVLGAWSTINIDLWLRYRTEKLRVASMLETKNQSLQGKALQKLNKLSEEERTELTKIIYQDNQIKRSTVQQLFRVFWLSIVVAIVLQVLQEIARRI